MIRKASTAAPERNCGKTADKTWSDVNKHVAIAVHPYEGGTG